MKPTKGTPHLTLAQSVALLELLRAEYATSGMTDPDFARLATERLGHTYSHAQVSKVRHEFGIASNKRPSPSANLTNRQIAAELAKLRADFEALRVRLGDAQAH